VCAEDNERKYKKNPKFAPLEEQFQEEFLKCGEIKKAAVKVRPDLSVRGAEGWGQKVMKDPEVRRRMHNVEQGGLFRMRVMLDTALDVIENILTDPDIAKKTKLDAAALLIKRIYGAVPESVTLIKFSLFDGEDKRMALRDHIRRRMEETTPEVVSGETEDGYAGDTGPANLSV